MATEPVVSGLAATPGVNATYKAREVEETLDVWFYRPIGYQIARAAWRLRLTPNAVTALGGLLGILAGQGSLERLGRGLDRRLVGFRNLVAIILQRLLGRMHKALALVLRLDQFAALLSSEALASASLIDSLVRFSRNSTNSGCQFGHCSLIFERVSAAER